MASGFYIRSGKIIIYDVQAEILIGYVELRRSTSIRIILCDRIRITDGRDLIGELSRLS